MNNEEKLKAIRLVIEKLIQATTEEMNYCNSEFDKYHQIGTLTAFIRAWNLFDDYELDCAVNKYGVAVDDE